MLWAAGALEWAEQTELWRVKITIETTRKDHLQSNRTRRTHTNFSNQPEHPSNRKTVIIIHTTLTKPLNTLVYK